MSGSNYFVSVRQIFESERKIRVQSLVRYNSFTTINAMESLEEIEETEKTCDVFDRAADLIRTLSESRSLQTYDEADFAISYYISGYASRVIIRRLTSSCNECIAQFSCQADENLCIEFEYDCNPALSAEFVKSIDRGGLCYPSEGVFFLCNVCTNAFRILSKDASLRNKLIEDSNPRQLFVEIITTTLMSIDNHLLHNS